MHIKQPSAQFTLRAKSVLRSGGIIAYPTESCYGLGCDPMNANALKKILSVKQRPNHKGMIVVAAHLDQVKHLIRPLTELEMVYLNDYWPGPFTFLIEASKFVLPLLRGHHKKIAIRITAHPETAGLCKALNLALVSTSANKAKMRSIKSKRDLYLQLHAHLLCAPGHLGKSKKASTIIDLETKKRLR